MEKDYDNQCCHLSEMRYPNTNTRTPVTWHKLNMDGKEFFVDIECSAITDPTIVNAATTQYYTKFLFREAWDPDNESKCRITGEELKKRLPKAKLILFEKAKIFKWYRDHPRDVEVRLRDLEVFVKTFIEKEEAGLHPYVIIS